MFNLEKFIADSVINRSTRMFTVDIEANKKQLTVEIKDKKVCVIYGAVSLLQEIFTNDENYRKIMSETAKDNGLTDIKVDSHDYNFKKN